MCNRLQLNKTKLYKKHFMKNIKSLILLTSIIFMASCSSDSPVDDSSKDISVKTIVINGSNITDGKSKQLSLVILPNNATNKSVAWDISDTSIATISNSGVLTPLENGTIKVTVTAQDNSGVSAEKTITISGVVGPPVLVESITVVGNDITDGNSLQLSTTILPTNATNKSVVWSVSDTSIADVNNVGLLTPKQNGTVTVKATALDASGKYGELVVNISGITPVYSTILKAENMLLWQRNNGGWPKEPYNDFSGYERAQTASEIATAENTKNNTDTTIDNNHTVGELRYLLSAYKATSNPEYLDAATRGIDYLFQAQYGNGGWPQYYPLRTDYSRHITYNDNAMGNVMNLMRDIFLKKNNLDLIDESYVAKAQTAFDKGIDVILQTQIVINGKKTAWCAQHDAVTLAPAKARSYELASNSGSESVGVTRLLMTLENPSSEVIDAVNSAVAWFEEVKILDIATQNTGSDVVVVSSPGNVLWARFYDLNTNQPFFCGRDGIKKNTLAEIELERRTGYAWYGNWPKTLIASEYTSWKTKNGI